MTQQTRPLTRTAGQSAEDIATDAALATAIRSHLAAAALALKKGDDEGALKLLKEATTLKHELWARLEHPVRQAARRYAAFRLRRAGLDADDLVNESLFKFRKVIGRYDPDRGVPVRSWVLFVLGRFFIQLGRKRREQPRDDLVAQALRCSCHPAGALARVEVNDVLSTLLRGDPFREQKIQAFTGYWLERQTHLELAGQFGVSVSSIHRWLRQVRGAFSNAVAPSS